MEEPLPPAAQQADGSASPRYQAYAQYRQAYQDSLAAYHAAYTAALQNPAQLQQWPLAGKALQDRVDAAFRDWLALGHKTEVERTLAKRDLGSSE